MTWRHWFVLLMAVGFPLLANDSADVARQAMKDGDHETAIRQWLKALKTAKPFKIAEYQTQLALCYQQSKQFDKALAIWQALSERYPKDMDHVLRRGLVNSWMNRRRKAMELFREVLNNVPDYHDARLGLARVLSWNKEYDEALVELEKILKAVPQHVGALDLKLTVLMWSGRRDQALTIVDALLVQSPTSLALRRQKARLLVGANQIEAGLALFESLVKEFPDKADLRAELGTLQSRHARLEDAIGNLERAVALRADDLETFLQLGRTYAWSQRQEEAIDLYRRALAADPRNMEAQMGLARSLYWSGQWAEAERLVEGVVEGHPDHHEALELVEKIGRTRRPDVSVSWSRKIYKDYSALKTRYGDRLEFVDWTAQVNVPLSPVASIIFKEQRGYERSYDLVGNEVDHDVGHRRHSMRLNASRSGEWFLGAQATLTDYEQRGASVFQLRSRSRRESGFIYYGRDYENWRQTVSLSRDDSLSRRSAPTRSTLRRFDSASYLVNWDRTEQQQLHASIELETIEERADRVDSRLGSVWTLGRQRDFKVEVEWRHRPHLTIDTPSVALTRWGEIFADRLLWELELESEYEVHSRVVSNELSGRLSFATESNRLKLDLELSGLQMEVNDRDRSLDLEVSLNYDF